MVSGSPCPLIRFLDVSYSVSFVVRGSGPVGDDDLWYHHRQIFSFFSGLAERKLQHWEGLGSSWVSLGASKEGLRAS